MHVLARGDVLQRLRLATGLILFTFAATHFLNHALGLVSLDAMEAMQGWRKAVTRSWPGTIVLLSAFRHPHPAGALQALPPPHLAAAVLGGRADRQRVFHPAVPHHACVFNRGAASLGGTDDTYAFELANIWPGLALEHAALLAVRVGAWLHRHALLAEPGALVSRSVRHVLFALAVALPVTALAGFLGGGPAGGGANCGARRWGEAAAAARAPDAATVARLVTAARPAAARRSSLCLGLRCWCPIVRIVRRAAGARVEVTYRGGPTVRVAPGPTLLEISRMKDVPHASVCGGRARCSTCRVGVESGLETCRRRPPPKP